MPAAGSARSPEPCGRWRSQRHLVHGHGAGRPDPDGDRGAAARLAEPGLAAVHQLLRGHRCLDALSGFVSSRIGAKRTLLSGLVLIISFCALAGASNTSARSWASRRLGSRERAVHRHRALGDHRLGQRRCSRPSSSSRPPWASASPSDRCSGRARGITWRGPFFGVAALMTIAFVATAFLPAAHPAARPPSGLLADPLRALRYRAPRGIGVTAVFYNFGFFTLLAYTPFPLDLTASSSATSSSAGGCCSRSSRSGSRPGCRRFGDVADRGRADAFSADLA